MEIVKKMGTENLQNGGTNRPKSSPEGAKRGPERPKNRKKNRSNKNHRGVSYRRPKTIEELVNFGSLLASRIEPKSNKNTHKIQSKKRCILESILKDFGGFLMKNGCMLTQKSNKNRCQLRITIFWKNLVFPKEKQWFWGSSGSKLEVNIDEKSTKKSS